MLVICNHCHRHIRHTEASCPFCGTLAPERSSRYGVGLAVALTLASALGCSDDSGDSIVAVYAGPPAGGATAQGGANNNGGVSAQGGTIQSTTAKGTGGGMILLYAGPPTGGASANSSSTGGGMGIPIYSAPPAPGSNGTQN